MKACPYCAETVQDAARKCKHCGEMIDGGNSSGSFTNRTLTRSRSDKMLMGVCGGLAKYLDMDPGLVRVGVALITFFSGILTGLIIYVILGAVLPEGE